MERWPSDWLKWVKMHVEDGVPMTYLANKYKFNVSHLKHKVHVHMLHGEAPFTDEQASRVYKREDKLKAIKAVLNGEKSGRQAAAELGALDSTTVNDWIQLYIKQRVKATFKTLVAGKSICFARIDKPILLTKK